MHEKQKKHFTVCIEDEFGFTLSHAEYTGTELGFWVWYKQLVRNWSFIRRGERLFFPHYSYPVEG